MNDDLDTENGKHCDLDTLCARQRLAKDHAALFPTRLALARWRGGCTPAQPQAEQPSAQVPERAAWFARILRDHQVWLDCGGFAQHEELPPLRQPTMWQPPVAAPLLSTPRPAQDGDVRECGTCN